MRRTAPFAHDSCEYHVGGGHVGLKRFQYCMLGSGTGGGACRSPGAHCIHFDVVVVVAAEAVVAEADGDIVEKVDVVGHYAVGGMWK